MRPSALYTTTIFQSTIPVWGGTVASFLNSTEIVGISIHPPRVGRDHKNDGEQDNQDISIHPPRVGRDGGDLMLFDAVAQISIHPPREGRDTARVEEDGDANYFKPPSPCGEGLTQQYSAQNATVFQSTLPVWGGTRLQVMESRNILFQSTLPVWGGTSWPV